MITIHSKLVVTDHDAITGYMGLEFDPEGVETVTDATVAAKGDNILDINVGDVVVYPRSRGVRFTIDGVFYNVIDYGSVLIVKKQQQ